MKYTVILLRPDYIAGTFGEDTYMTCVEADSVLAAQTSAQTEAVLTDNEGCTAEEIEEAVAHFDDYFVIAVIAGDHQDIKQ